VQPHSWDLSTSTSQPGDDGRSRAQPAVAAIHGGEVQDHDHHNQVGNGPIGDVIPPVLGFNDDGKNCGSKLGTWRRCHP